MLGFALKNMAIKKVQIILVVLSIMLSAGIGVLAYNVASQVDDGITQNAGYYSVIVGPSGSQTQLAMNTMYFTDEPLGTIPYSVVTQLQMDGTRVSRVIPFAMADSYNGSDVVGTTAAFLDGKSIASGEMFDDTTTLQVVVGYNVAKINELKVGDTIYTSHSAGGTDTHAQGLTVVGILEQCHSVYDNVVFTQIRTLWAMHDHSEAYDEHGNEEHSEEEHQHTAGTVCAILINTKNPAYAMQLANEYDGMIFNTADGESFTLQAIEPMAVVRDVLNDADNTKYIVFVLCAVILVMNIMIISIITLLNMYHSAKEISLMRLIGVSMKKINLLYIIQNSLVGLVSTLMAFGLSRLCLTFMGDYVASMGVVLNTGKIYSLEFIILGGVFLISVLPTMIWTFFTSRKDSISS
ncbi:MAG: ABC transporter permease [Ruminococcaceae bacterium]|nr:ABC transporter permease [Oscillospiraceae bacterium]